MINDIAIIIFTLFTVIFIVFIPRIGFENKLISKFGIDRDWYIPVMALGVAFALSLISLSTIGIVFLDKIEIIVLIFSFAIISEGLAESGFFSYIAYRITEKCGGDSFRLVLYLYILTSIITLFTSNDIVVLVLTPVVLAICVQSNFKNAKLILMSQFVAANTLSMGLIIGSPTNLIIGNKLDINFIYFLALMILPAIVAFLATFTLIDFIQSHIQKKTPFFFSDLIFPKKHNLPDKIPFPVFTKQMGHWILIFAGVVVLVAIDPIMKISLLGIGLIGIAVSFIYMNYYLKNPKYIVSSLMNIPYGIFFFGMTFFMFAYEFSRGSLATEYVVPYLNQHIMHSPIKASLVGVFGSGFLVNVFNDLPASALLSELYPKLEADYVTKTIFLQAVLIGVNIGCYVTPVGALAGIIWFNTLRVHRNKLGQLYKEQATQLILPTRGDLVRFGVVNFLFVGLLSGLLLIFIWFVILLIAKPY
ncbi:hypothetical protein HZA75_07445 [Candidatus Roizmanbacteria bacterium]|nr:hypothetical protein [Candidatus Roizmanbacteria bacterium]